MVVSEPGMTDEAETDWPSVLRHFRFTHNIKQAALAHDLGVTQAMVSRWESGQARPGPELQVRIQELFDRHELGTPMLDWRQFMAENPAFSAIVSGHGRIETASTGMLRETGLERDQIEGFDLARIFEGDAVALFAALRDAGFFDGRVESAESADLLCMLKGPLSGSGVHVHGLHWPRVGEDGRIRWVISGARVSEKEFEAVRAELGGQVKIVLTK